MKYSIITLLITPLLLFSCSPEKEGNHSGPLISKVDIQEDSVETIDNNFIPDSTIVEKQQNLINNSNVLEKLKEYGLKNQETKENITTKFGSIKIRLFNDTPLHRANFIMLTKGTISTLPYSIE